MNPARHRFGTMLSVLLLAFLGLMIFSSTPAEAKKSKSKYSSSRKRKSSSGWKTAKKVGKYLVSDRDDDDDRPRRSSSWGEILVIGVIAVVISLVAKVFKGE